MRVYRQTLRSAQNEVFVEDCLRGLQRDVPVDWGRGAVTYRGPVLRYSGEVTTSLGNTLNNIICIVVGRAVADGLDLDTVCWDDYLATCPLVCEGDDSIQAIPGSDPESRGAWCQRLTDCLQRFGLVVKPEVHDHVSTAGFCGCYWNPRTGGRYCRDPLYSLAKLCWTSSAVNHRELLALKAQALALQAPDQPLVAGLVHYLRRDGWAHGVHLDRYDVERYNVLGLGVLPTRGVGYAIRLSKGDLRLPSAADYQYWADRWATAASVLREADAQAAEGNLRPLQSVLASLTA